MLFEELLGNEEIKNDLMSALKNGRLGNSLLFSGPHGVGKKLFAKALAHQLVDSTKEPHPDIHIYRPEGRAGVHSVEMMRKFSEEVYMAPFEAPYKVFILDDADRMNVYSANALLKTFEEPAENAVIILVSAHPDRLLPTILSRCRQFRFSPVPVGEIQKRVGDPLVARLAEGSMGRALKLASQEQEEVRDKVLGLLERVPLSYADIYPEVKGIATLIEGARDESSKNVAPKEMSAAMREGVEKEAEGVATVAYQDSVEEVFALCLSWYRDLAALAIGAKEHLIFDEERLSSTKRRIGLEGMTKVVEDARLALHRSTPLGSVLEGLFLRI